MQTRTHNSFTHNRVLCGPLSLGNPEVDKLSRILHYRVYQILPCADTHITSPENLIELSHVPDPRARFLEASDGTSSAYASWGLLELYITSTYILSFPKEPWSLLFRTAFYSFSDSKAEHCLSSHRQLGQSRTQLCLCVLTRSASTLLSLSNDSFTSYNLPRHVPA